LPLDVRSDGAEWSWAISLTKLGFAAWRHPQYSTIATQQERVNKLQNENMARIELQRETRQNR
jgi:hypothetical protein